MKEFFSLIGKLAAAIITIIISIMISAWAFSIIYGAARGFISDLPDVSYGTCMAVATMCVLIVKFWPLRIPASNKTVDLISWDGLNGLLSTYMTQLIYIGSAALALLIASQF